MACKRYTHCVEKDQFDGMCGPAKPLVVYGLVHGLVGALIGALVGAVVAVFGRAPIELFVAIGIGAGFFYGAFNGICERWLNQRLICIEHDQCALGRVAALYPPKQDFFRDENDYTLDLLLTPHEPTSCDRGDVACAERVKQTVWEEGLQGSHFIRQRFPDLPYGGQNKDEAWRRWTLHCEFEGAQIATMCSFSKLLAPVAGVAGVAAFSYCLAAGILVAILCAFLALILMAFITYVLARWFGEDGSPADAATDTESGTLREDDCIVVYGDHVYDAGHCEGWHEIHPVCHVQKIPDNNCPQGDLSNPGFRAAVENIINSWCDQLTVAGTPAVKEAQLQPENRWCVHPEIDGCEPPIPPIP